MLKLKNLTFLSLSCALNKEMSTLTFLTDQFIVTVIQVFLHGY